MWNAPICLHILPSQNVLKLTNNGGQGQEPTWNKRWCIYGYIDLYLFMYNVLLVHVVLKIASIVGKTIFHIETSSAENRRKVFNITSMVNIQHTCQLFVA